MASSHRAGEGEQFSDYYDIDPVVSGKIDDISYEIYEISGTHYSLYAHLPRICPCMIETGVLPPLPVRGNINFGPTKDGWIGFTTNGVSEYNYTKNWEPLQRDRREEANPRNYFDQEDINRWTPRLLETALTDWIQNIASELEGLEMQCSHD